ncbi:MAG: hypothetical protein ACK4RZ_11455 [Paracoccaceae bacterium]
MPDRREIWLDGNDTIAAAQIISWIARPKQPERAMKVLNHWYWIRHRKLGNSLPDECFNLMMPKRMEGQFLRIQDKDCRDAFRAAAWAQHAILKASPPMFGRKLSDRGIRSLAAAGVDDEEQVGNEISKIWSKRKPVAHMCLAAGNAIGRHHRERGWCGFGLSGSLLQPTWVTEAIEQSEEWARSFRHLPNPANYFHFRR